MMKYENDIEITDIIKDIITKLNLDHVKIENIFCVRSHGSKSRRTVARIHGLSRIMQKAMSIKAVYVIEIISENFDKLSHEDKIKTIIHEIMHIPHNFGGGFRGHSNFVTRKNVEKAYETYTSL
ncbi:hypothetical protein A3K64_02825 [Candidatus Micrarchaeota archaeon RBG_16_36_9]|nr:MAG: hypothetical protein A3K64_02825 [Candidatus Micrarchaeota archaeon RBG_16_36_9]